MPKSAIYSAMTKSSLVTLNYLPAISTTANTALGSMGSYIPSLGLCTTNLLSYGSVLLYSLLYDYS